MAHTKEYAQLHLIVILWGFTAVLGLLITIPVVEMIFYRTFISAIALGFLVRLRKLNFGVDRVSFLKITSTGILFAAHWILFFLAARVANASVALVGFATTTFWTSLVEPIMTRKRIKGYEVFLGLMVVVGIYIIFQANLSYALGLSLGIGCAIIAAVFTVLNKMFIRTHHHYTITFYEMAGAAISILIFLPLYSLTITKGSIDLTPTLLDWVYLLVLSLICTVFTVSTATKLMKKLSAYSINLVVNLEPVYGILLAVLVFGDSEKMSLNFYIGGMIIILSIIGYPMFRKRERGYLSGHL